jgi:hypothetical protein
MAEVVAAEARRLLAAEREHERLQRLEERRRVAEAEAAAIAAAREARLRAEAEAEEARIEARRRAEERRIAAEEEERREQLAAELARLRGRSAEEQLQEEVQELRAEVGAMRAELAARPAPRARATSRSRSPAATPRVRFSEVEELKEQVRRLTEVLSKGMARPRRMTVPARNDVCGSDPAPGQEKWLRMELAYTPLDGNGRGTRELKEAQQGQLLEFNIPALHYFTIVSAMWGNKKGWDVDVLPKMKEIYGGC